MLRSVRIWSPICSSCRCRMRLAGGSSCASMTCGVRCTMWTSRPWLRKPRAASMPRSPPPITTAARASCARSQHPIAVVDRAKDERAVFQRPIVGHETVDRRQQRAAAGRDDQRCRTARRHRFAPITCRLDEIEAFDPVAGMQPDAVGGVPRQRVDDDVVHAVGAGEDAREQDPVVVAVRLVAEHRDVEDLVAALGDHVLDESGAGHAVADDDEARP